MYIGSREKLILLLLAAVAVLGYWLFEWMGLGAHPGSYAAEREAARRTLQAELAIRDAKDSDTVLPQVAPDDVQAGMIGLSTSPITTDPGSLRSKITSTNPNFAAVVVSLLKKAGVGGGDVVAVSYTGSFPALDIAAIVAIETVGATPIIISSVGASTWGANDPTLTILDMESLLADRGIIRHRSVAAAMGGDYRVRPLSDEGRKLASAAIQRNKVRLTYAKSISEAVDQDMEIYRQEAADRPIKAFVNVGGGLPGRGVGANYDPGLTVAPPRGEIIVEGLLSRMQDDGVPVINLVDIKNLAQRYGLPVSPLTTPPPGEGGIFRAWTQLRIVAGLLAFALAVVLFATRFLVLAPMAENAVDSYFGTAPQTFRAWLRSLGIPLRQSPPATAGAPADEN